jgi:hypothetical protein
MLQESVPIWIILKDLVHQYLFTATPFFILHISLFVYFLILWMRSRARTRGFLSSLEDKNTVSDVLHDAEEQIKEYAAKGREPDLPRIEESITAAISRGSEKLRPLINIFVVIGLMGTIFALFRMGSQTQAIKDPHDVFSGMSVAFSASFFGLFWAVLCTLFLYGPLQQLTALAIKKTNQRISALSILYPPRTSENTLEEVAQGLNEKLELMARVILRLELRRNENLKASRDVLNEFRTTTKSTIELLVTQVKEAQTQAKKTSEDLRLSVDSSLQEVKKQFSEISQSWRTELEKTIKVSEETSKRLSVSTDNLSKTTKAVSISLQGVQKSLERTKALAQIVDNIEEMTARYLEQTQQQMVVFHKGLGDTVESARMIPDEWFTMLGRRNNELTSGLAAISEGWKEHVTKTSEELSGRFDKMGEGISPLVNLLSPEGQLLVVLNELQLLLKTTKEWIEYKSKVDPNIQIDNLLTLLRTLEQTIAKLQPQSGSQFAEPATYSNANGIQKLVVSVNDIHALITSLMQDGKLNAGAGADAVAAASLGSDREFESQPSRSQSADAGMNEILEIQAHAGQVEMPEPQIVLRKDSDDTGPTYPELKSVEPPPRVESADGANAIVEIQAHAGQVEMPEPQIVAGTDIEEAAPVHSDPGDFEPKPSLISRLKRYLARRWK